MAQPEKALEWIRGWTTPDGWLVLPQSESAAEVTAPAGVRFEATRRYQVPLGGPARTIWLGRAAERP
jgi:hypothetical protein